MKIAKLLNPKQTAVIVIDIQRAYCSKDAPLTRHLKLDTSPIDKMIPKLEEFIQESRKHKTPIIWTRSIEDPKYAPKNLRTKMLAEKWVVISTPNALSFDYYKIRPKKGDKEFVKKQYDAFTNSNLQKYLENKKIKTLILTGVHTSRCVDSTMRSASAKGYHVVIPEDLVAVPKQLINEHKATLSVCQNIFGYVVKSKDILDVWDFH